MTTRDSLFKLATSLRNEGKLRESVEVLSKVLAEYPADRYNPGIHTVLGGVYSNLEEYENALINFRKATELNPKSELASLGLYVTLSDLDKDEEALHELFRYLKIHPADLYKDTLEELLEGLAEGYMTKYGKEIIELAKANGVGS
jgi:tetratricopeptide (TPR) repeat protein